ncbi:hypothetical protein [Nocardia sp. BMG51109]|uniref:hypothetical protein n=1 Tax=Nocardia sp. BMG51109 TaxID=1056816 RepID=UPI000463CD32|nr:hypothetical protein [Nocardia sp. BMG51109]
MTDNPRHITAAWAIETAARYWVSGSAFDEAVRVQTADLSRDELVLVAGLLGARLSGMVAGVAQSRRADGE